jgi:hypothetical protein
MRRLSILLSLSCVTAVTLSLAACGAAHDDLPQGVQTLTGVIRSAELSRTRRGTHVLEQDGEPIYFVESGSRNLRTFEGKDVTVTGNVERNTDRNALPVLILKDIQSEQAEPRVWKVPALRMTLKAPDSWQGRTSGSGITFRLAGRTDPILNIRTTPVAQLPKGDSVLIGVDQGRWVRNEATGQTNVYLSRPGRMILFQFTPPPDSVLPYLDQHLRDLLRSVSFEGVSTSAKAAGTGAVVTGTGSVKKDAPCGGAAGFLCPAGYYCEINDQVNNIGACRKL